MLRLYSDREYGHDSPVVLSRAETTRRIYCLELGKHKDVERNHDSGVNSLDIDLVENRYLLSGGANGGICVHDLENPCLSKEYTYSLVCSVDKRHKYAHRHSIQTVQWYPVDTGMFTSSGTDRLLKVWDTNRLVPADTFEFAGIIYSHHMSSIASKHNLLAVGCQGSTVKLVDLKAGSATHMLKGHKDSVLAVKWSNRDEFMLATSSADNRVLIWDVRAAKSYLMSLDQHNGSNAAKRGQTCTAHDGSVNGLCFTADGLFLLTFGTDNQLRLWNTHTGRNVMVNYGNRDNDKKTCVQIAISHSGYNDVVFVPNDANLDIMELQQGLHVHTLKGHYNNVNCCVLHPYTHELFSGGNDRNILVWVPDTNAKHHEETSEMESKPITGTEDAWSSDEGG